ncbi:phage holin family protein [Paenarthrobacter sp. NPDC089322]|uniref:phage holin family protein n=1 Tax=Paenarthrobacter sp. NPDC089322 TaxID=3155065 RepID=UPI00342D8903
MGSFIVRVLINGLALWIASWLLEGLEISTAATEKVAANAGMTDGAATAGIVLAYLFIGLIFGIVNAFVRPLVRLLSLPVTILTLGLFTIVINAAMLYLTAWLSSFTPVHLTIDSFFWTAILAAIIISIISMVAGLIPGARKR